MGKNMSIRRRAILNVVLLLGMVMILATACAPGHPRFSAEERPAGFFWGIWHGWIAPFSLIGGFFNPSIRLYERNNNGWWYDFGFYLAVVGGFGSVSLFRRKRDRD